MKPFTSSKCPGVSYGGSGIKPFIVPPSVGDAIIIMQKLAEYNFRRGSVADRMVVTSTHSTGFDYLHVILALGTLRLKNYFPCIVAESTFNIS